MKRTCFLLFIIIQTTVFSLVQAQQNAQYSQYMLNYYSINPAASGFDDFLDIQGGYRQQWRGMSSSPQNMYLSAHASLGKVHNVHASKMRNKKMKHYSAVGGIITGQQLGALSQYSFSGSYAHHIPLNTKWAFSVGASAGLFNYRINESKLNFGDQVIDPVLTEKNSLNPDFSLGAWLYSDRVFAGISSTQILQSNWAETGGLKRHIYLTAGYKLPLQNGWSLVPSVLFKSVLLNAYQTDVNVKVRYQNQFWLGTSYRHQDAVVFLAGASLGQYVDIGYAYEMTTSLLRAYSYGSHEVMLRVKLYNLVSFVSPNDFW